jgi:hypothetical protein
MKLNTLFKLNALVALLFGLTAFVTPTQLMTAFGSVSDPIGHHMLRYFGAMLLGNAVWLWLAAKISDPIVQRWVILAEIVTWLLILSLHIWALVSGLNDNSEWINIILALLFLAGYGYFWMKPTPQSR